MRVKFFCRIAHYILPCCLLILSHGPLHAQTISDSPPQIPAQDKESIYYNQNFNLPGLPTLLESQKKVVPLYHVLVPKNEIENLWTSDIDPITKKFLLTKKWGHTYYRIFFESSEHKIYKQLTKKYGKQPIKYWSTGKLSHNTKYVFDPSNQTSIEIKLPKVTGISVTHSHTVKNAIVINEIVTSIFKNNAKKFDKNDPLVSFLPENVGLNLNNSDYSLSFRRREPIKSKDIVDAKLIVLHGFLGSPLVSETARAHNMTTDKYLTEIYPRELARWTAFVNYKLGLYPGAHTQNLAVYIDNKTKKIKGFAFLDLNDVAIDPLILFRNGYKNTLAILERLKLTKLLGVNNMTLPSIDMRLGSKTSGPGWINGAFIGNDHLSLAAPRASLFRQIMDNYMDTFVDEVERITGIKINKNNLPVSTASKIGIETPGYDAFQEIYETTAAKLIPDKTDNSAKFDQYILRKIFLKYNSTPGQFAMLSELAQSKLKTELTLNPSSTPNLRFSFDGENITVFEKDTSKLLAIIFGLSPKDIIDVQASFSSTMPKCHRLKLKFKRLFRRR